MKLTLNGRSLIASTLMLAVGAAAFTASSWASPASNTAVDASLSTSLAAYAAPAAGEKAPAEPLIAAETLEKSLQEWSYTGGGRRRKPSGG